MVKRHCVGHTLFSFLRINSVTTSSNLSKLFSAGLINKKNEKKNKQTNKLMIYLSFVKLYFSSTFNYVQFNHIKLDVKVPVLPSAPHVRLPNRQCHAFLQERLQNAVKRSKNWKPCAISRGRAQKMCVHSLLKKRGGGVQKTDKLIDFRRTWN